MIKYVRDLVHTLYNGIAAFMIKTAVLVPIVIVLEWRVQYRDWTALFFLLFFFILELFETPYSIGLIFLLKFITTIILNINIFTVGLQAYNKSTIIVC